MAEPPKRLATRRHGESYGVGTWQILARVARVKTGKMYNLRGGVCTTTCGFVYKGKQFKDIIRPEYCGLLLQEDYSA
jgi:hypothetical protein